MSVRRLSLHATINTQRPGGSGFDASGGRMMCVLVGMKDLKSRFADETAKIGYALLWLIGVPLPILVLIDLFRG
jgi:hypothetical protein